MDWFGLNWTDILLGTALLAIVPGVFAAYGGQLATETITDPKRRIRIKVGLWALFLVGVALAFWQQFRAAQADQNRDTRETWAEALFTHGSKQQITPPIPCEQKSAVSKEKPDISLALIYPEQFGIVLINNSNVLLKSPKWWFALWDLDKLDDQGHVWTLPIPATTGDWIRPHEGMGPEAAMSLVASSVHKGDRILGFIGVLCPECKRSKNYLVYAVHGQDGWYAELPYVADLSAVYKIMPEVRKDPEALLKNIPQSWRVKIAPDLHSVPF